MSNLALWQQIGVWIIIAVSVVAAGLSLERAFRWFIRLSLAIVFATIIWEDREMRRNKQ